MRNSIWALVLTMVITIGCKKEEGITVPLQNEVNEFVWFAMNGYYYWQSDVEDLTLDKYPTYNALYEFLNVYDQPEELFSDLLVDEDRFSWIVDDYEELEASFQGTGKSFGYELGLLRLTSNSNQLLGYVKYIVPGGPADLAGLKRGDFFLQVDNTALTLDNYTSLLLESSNYTIALADIQEDSFVSTNQTITLNAVELTENPILISDVIEIEGQRVGYFMYNQFISNNDYHQEMNNAFGAFVSEGITDLVLDLRYNGGGSLLTSRILSSMIYGSASSSDILGSLIYNEKLSEINQDFTFLNEVPVLNNEGAQTSTLPMNRLSINRVFILTTGSSASASEFVIAGLLPYMDVTLIGTKTVGKNVASRTFYDSPDSGYTQKGADLNPNHKYAIQPIISQLSNSEGFTDYIDGLEPNIEVNEVNFIGDFRPLGDPAEPLLAEALAIITGVARTERKPDNGLRAITPDDGKDYLNTIWVDSGQLPMISQ